MAEPEPWYRTLFTGDYLTLYADRLKDRETKREVTMVEEVLQLPPGASILDVACGTGRHIIRLAAQGFRVTGLDLNESYIEMVQTAAAAAQVEVDAVAGDMREIPFEAEFDAVVSLFTSFGYFETEEDDLRVLSGVIRALKPGGKYLLDVGNREWYIQNGEERWGEDADGTVHLVRRDFNPITSINTTVFYAMAPDGTYTQEGTQHIRLYTMTEMLRLLRLAGLTFVASYGDYRLKPYTTRSKRMIILAMKPA